MHPSFIWIYITGAQWDQFSPKIQADLEALWLLGVSGTISIPTFPDPVYVDDFCTSITYIDQNGTNSTHPIARVRKGTRLW
jgi:hypothetical protein